MPRWRIADAQSELRTLNDNDVENVKRIANGSRSLTLCSTVNVHVHMIAAAGDVAGGVPGRQGHGLRHTRFQLRRQRRQRGVRGVPCIWFHLQRPRRACMARVRMDVCARSLALRVLQENICRKAGLHLQNPCRHRPEAGKRPVVSGKRHREEVSETCTLRECQSSYKDQASGAKSNPEPRTLDVRAAVGDCEMAAASQLRPVAARQLVAALAAALPGHLHRLRTAQSLG